MLYMCTFGGGICVVCLCVYRRHVVCVSECVWGWHICSVCMCRRHVICVFDCVCGRVWGRHVCCVFECVWGRHRCCVFECVYRGEGEAGSFSVTLLFISLRWSVSLNSEPGAPVISVPRRHSARVTGVQPNLAFYGVLEIRTQVLMLV